MSAMLDPGRSRLVIAGAHKYEHLEALPAVKNNLGAMVDVLTDSEICGISRDACKVISQPEVPGQVLDALYGAGDECTDTLIFYFSGHGLTSAHNDELLLAIPGSDPARPHTAVRFEDVRMAVLSARRAPKKLVILDCCFSGRAMIGSMAPSTDLAARSEIEGSYILTAAAETKTALAPPGEQYTAFTGEFLELLREGCVGGSSYLDMETLYRNLRDRLAAKSYPVPQQRNRNAGARILLAKNRKANGRDPESRLGRLVQYIEENPPRGPEPAELRTEARAEYLPYQRRIRAAEILGRNPDYQNEARDLLLSISNDFHASLNDRASSFGALARMGWRVDEMKNNLLMLASSSAAAGHNSDRIGACQQLDRLGDKGAAITGYMSIVMDSNLNLRSRAYSAGLMVKRYPEEKDSALRVMWAAAVSSDVLPQHRIDTLHEICAIDAGSAEKASVMIREIRASKPSGGGSSQV